MKAITRRQYGGPEVLHFSEVTMPVVRPGELLIKVHATTVNRTDCGILWGMPAIIRLFTGLRKPTQQIPGTDFAGEIVSVGEGVNAFYVGERVWGFYDQGLQSNAVYMRIKANGPVAAIPDGISYTDAAASGEGAHYAYNFIKKANFAPGASVLVIGATGAIGSAMVQLLTQHYGLQVVAVADGDFEQKVLALGATRVINYKTSDYSATEKGPYDFVFDAVGKSEFRKASKLLRPGGIYISSELGPGAENLYLPLTTLFRKGPRVIFPLPVNCKASVELITDLMQQGKFKPMIDRVYPPESIREAYNYVRSGRKNGNVVIDFSQWH